MVMDFPGPQNVGREFVRQYYTMLHEAPDYLYRFYSHNSSFLHDGADHQDEQLPAVGQSEINKKISSLKFRDCHAKIRQVDSQWSISNSVVIQVAGELSNNGSPMRRFTQTFVLGQQNPKKYYVHNDIFRYQDEVSLDSGNDVEAIIEPGEAEILEKVEDGHHASAAQENETVHLYYEEDAEPSQVPANIQVSNGTSLEVEPKESPKEDEAAEAQLEVELLEAAEVSEAVDAEVEPVKEAEEDGLSHAEPFTKNEAEEEKKPVTQELEQVAAIPQKPTWAAMASRNPSASSSIGVMAVTGGVTGNTPKPVQAAKQPEPKIDNNPVAPGLPQRVPRGPKVDPAAQDGCRGATDGGDDAGRNMQKYPDNQQVFVGNLPRSLADKDLREFFEKFGGVLDMRINRKINNTNLPNFGFVVFDSPETVQKVLSERPLMFNGKHRVNVEEKKPREELMVSRPRSATHTVGKPGAGRGADVGAAGRPNAAPSATRNYAKGAVNDEGKSATR